MSTFSDFLNMAKAEKQAQKLLFLFAKASNMFDQKERQYQSGTIESIMCVDKSIAEITTFEDLVKEADQQSRSWNFIFASTISGENNREPTNTEVDKALHKMSNTFANGEDLSQFIIWNRNEQVMIIS